MLKVLSLFDGYSGARVALDRLGHEVDYWASEVNEHSIKVSRANYPHTTHVGDVTKVTVRHGQLHVGQNNATEADFDLLVGGSPCQGFSRIGTKLNFEHHESKLFFEYIRLLRDINPRYFLLENVRMKPEWADIITQYMGVQPLAINSALFTAQNRPRLYWTNIPVDLMIEDRGIKFKDILLSDVTERISAKGLEYMNREPHSKRHWSHAFNSDKDKSKCLVANLRKGVPYNVLVDGDIVRPLHPVECERLQGLPDGYTESVAKTHRLEILGNGFTVPVIQYILSGMEVKK